MTGDERKVTMASDKVTEALDGLSARDLESLRAKIDKRLAACIVCGSDGAAPYRFYTPKAASSAVKVRVSLLLCPACFEKNRLPETRADQSASSKSDTER